MKRDPHVYKEKPQSNRIFFTMQPATERMSEWSAGQREDCICGEWWWIQQSKQMVDALDAWLNGRHRRRPKTFTEPVLTNYMYVAMYVCRKHLYLIMMINT